MDMDTVSANVRSKVKRLMSASTSKHLGSQNAVFSAETADRIKVDLSFFADLVTGWLIHGNVDLIEHAVFLRHSLKTKISINTDSSMHILSCKWRFEKGVAIFQFQKYGDLDQNAKCVAQRWAQTLPLWGRVFPFEGEVIINFNDAGVDPGISFCANDPRMTLVPDSVFVGTQAYIWIKTYFQNNMVKWEEKEKRAFWRGSTTGQQTGDIFTLPRVRLVQMGKAHSDLFDVGITSVVQRTEEESTLISEANLMADFVQPQQFGKMRYLINIDGNTSAWSALMEQLSSGGLVFKVDSPFDYEQWFYARLKPWENFIPVRSDLSDLIDLIRYFKNNDNSAREIAAAGQRLSLSMSLEGELAAAAQSIQARAERDAFETRRLGRSNR